jgi:hypothetical protein
MFAHTKDFYQAIALGIDAENHKASVYITNRVGIGTAREIILRNVMQEATPSPYELATGLIHGSNGTAITSSRQCDVLVYDPTVDPPKYAFQDFVVIEPETARVVTEVKSKFNQKEFNKTLKVARSVHQFSVPTLVFSYESVTFPSFADYFAVAVTQPNTELPFCVAVHSNNFLAFRPRTFANQHERFVLLLNCSAAADAYAGFSTAAFLQLYDAWLRKKENLSSENLYTWFNAQTNLPNEARVRIASNGAKQQGAIPM